MTISQTNSPRLPEPEVDGADLTPRIVRVGEERRLEAVVRLLAVDGEADPVRAERFIAFSATNGVRLDGMWCQLDASSGRIIHTALAVPSPGRTAMIFASRPRRERDVATVASLIDYATAAIGTEGVALAQALLDPTEELERRSFLEGGFTELARLSYLERPLPAKPGKSAVVWPDGVSVERYREQFDDEVIAILDASYEGTLDCPDLRGLRETADILRGHKATGSFEPDLWTILRIGGAPAGVLLLNPSPQQRSIELVYLGLSKHARGSGLGAKLLRHGLELVAGRPERRISLAVDEKNRPALALYRRAGFRKVLRRIALIRPAATGSGSSSS